MGDSSDALSAANHIFVLAFELVEAEIPRLDEQIAATLKSPPVQKAIQKTLVDFMQAKVASGDAGMSGADAQKLAQALEKNAGDPATKAFLDKVKATPEYKRLEASISAFEKAAKSSSLGVFIDKHAGILYVVGAGLVLGAGTALYVTKTGGTALNTALAPLKGHEFQILHIGKLQLKADLWDFQPDARVLGAHVVATGEWDKLKIDLKFGLLAQGSDIKEGQGQVAVKSGPVSLKLTADVKASTVTDGKAVPQAVNLGLKADYSTGQLKIGVGAMYQDRLLSGQASAEYNINKYLSAGATANVGQRDVGGIQYGALLTLTVNTN